MTISACCRRAAPTKQPQVPPGRARSSAAALKGSHVLQMPPSRRRSGRAGDASPNTGTIRREGLMANKEQKRSTREAKKPKQKKKGADKRAAGKGPTVKV